MVPNCRKYLKAWDQFIENGTVVVFSSKICEHVLVTKVVLKIFSERRFRTDTVISSNAAVHKRKAKKAVQPHTDKSKCK